MEIKQWCKTGYQKNHVKTEDLPCPYHIFWETEHSLPAHLLPYWWYCSQHRKL